MEKCPLSSGAARGNITPKDNILPLPFVFGINMDGVADEVYVRVLDLDDGNNRALFISFEMSMIPYAEETMQFICDNTGLTNDKIFLSATHTHEVPFIGIEGFPDTEPKHRIWYEEIKSVLKHAIIKAAQNKRPARIGFGMGKSYLNINRDEVGKSDPGVNFERPSDKTLALIRIEDEKGSPIAFVVNYAVHGVFLNGCIVDGVIKISGDIPGRTSTKLEEKFDGAVALWTSGAAGDQNPRIMSQYGAEIKDGKVTVKSLGEAGYMILDFLVDEHVNDILKVNETLKCDASNARIFIAEQAVSCPGRITESGAVPGAVAPKKTDSPPDAKYTLKLLTVGDIAIQGISAEVVTSIGAAVRGGSPYKKTILVTQAGKYGGYVPDDWGYENNTFEASGTPVQKGYAEPAFVKAFAEMFEKEKERSTP